MTSIMSFALDMPVYTDTHIYIHRDKMIVIES